MTATASPALLEVRDLTLTIGRRTLMRDFSMAVRGGGVWCILGANGVGKTLFLHTLVGLRRIDGGSVCFSGRPIDRLTTLEAARMRAFLPQKIHDAFSASALDTVMMGRHPRLSRWQWEGDDDRAVALAALHDVDLANLGNQDVATLSGGERQRVAIAALLAQQAPLMLLDEPVAHLDLHHQIMVLRHLASLVQGQEKAVLLSIHDLNLAFRFATHAMLFRDDGGVDQGPIGAVMNDVALTRAFRYPVSRVKVGQQTLFVPG